MNYTDKKLYELLGDKTLSLGCKLESYWFWVCDYVRADDGRNMLIDRFDEVVYDDGGFLVIWHEPTIADLHRWMNGRVSVIAWEQNSKCIIVRNPKPGMDTGINYDSSKSLLSQSKVTKLAIISLITSHS